MFRGNFQQGWHRLEGFAMKLGFSEGVLRGVVFQLEHFLLWVISGEIFHWKGYLKWLEEQSDISLFLMKVYQGEFFMRNCPQEISLRDFQQGWNCPGVIFLEGYFTWGTLLWRILCGGRAWREYGFLALFENDQNLKKTSFINWKVRSNIKT